MTIDSGTRRYWIDGAKREIHLATLCCIWPLLRSQLAFEKLAGCPKDSGVNKHAMDGLARLLA